MTRILVYVLTALVLCAATAACGAPGGNGSGDASASAPEPVSRMESGGPEPGREDAPESAGESDCLTEDEMPQNTPEHQAYVEQYLYPFATSGLFLKAFSPEDLSAFDEMSPSLFGYFYLQEDPANALGISDMETEIPGEAIEEVMMRYLPLTPEQVRTGFAQYYDPARKVYTASFAGLGGGPAEFMITDSRLTEEGVLVLRYDAYSGDYDSVPWPDGVFRWALRVRGELQIEVDGENFRFLSNKTEAGPGTE